MRSDDVTRAKKTAPVVGRVRVLISFGLLRRGETFATELSDHVRALAAKGLVEVISGGESQAGPGAAGQGDSGGGPESAEAESPTGAEPGEDPGSG